MKDIVLSPTCSDPYTTHGHDGILSSDGRVDNDKTVEVLAQASILAVEADDDMVAPSDMMDGRILKIRKKSGRTRPCTNGHYILFRQILFILLRPFRDAIDSKTEVAVDKSGYQLNPANFREAQRELELDHLEGADVLMVKPAEPYLDIIRHAKTLQSTHCRLSSFRRIPEFGLTYKVGSISKMRYGISAFDQKGRGGYYFYLFWWKEPAGLFSLPHLEHHLHMEMVSSFSSSSHFKSSSGRSFSSFSVTSNPVSKSE